MKEGWIYKPLSDLCDIFGRIGFRGYTKNDLVDSPEEGAITLSPSNIINGELCYNKCSYISWKKYEESPEIMINEGDVILVKTASIGKCALVKELPHKATLNPQFVVFKNLKINNAFLNFFLKSSYAQNKIQEFASGTAIPTFSQTKLGTLEVPVPSLSEQERIVKQLDEAFAKIDALKENAQKGLQAVKDLWQATLKEELRPKEGWGETSLGDVCSKISDGSHNPPQGIEYSEYPMLSSKNVRNDKFTFDAPRYLKKEDFEKEYKRTNVEKGDILLTIVGAGLGECCMYNDDKKVVFQRSVCVLKPKDSINNRFLMYLMLSNYDRLQKESNGSAQKGIYLKQLSQLLISLPSIELQKSITEKLDSILAFCNKTNIVYEQELSEYDTLKQSILRKAFSGEL